MKHEASQFHICSQVKKLPTWVQNFHLGIILVVRNRPLQFEYRQVFVTLFELGRVYHQLTLELIQYNLL
jgi:hypothetical protein